MKDNMFRLMYVVLGAVVGIMANVVNNSENALSYIIFAVLGAIVSLAIQNEYLDSTPKQVFGLVIGIIFLYPIAYILQYLVAVFLLLVDIVGWLFQITIIKILVILWVIFMVICFIWFLSDNKK